MSEHDQSESPFQSLVDAMQRSWPRASAHLANAGREIALGLRALADGLSDVIHPDDSEDEIRHVPIRRPSSPKRGTVSRIKPPAPEQPESDG